LDEGKSRLAGILTASQRKALAQSMLENTLKTLAAADMVERVLVVSRDPAVLELARHLGADALQEDCLPELNASLEFASRFAVERGASMTLALPADLPLIAARDIQALVEFASIKPCVVIAPDRRAEGTNALLTRPPGVIPYCFGAGSFKVHCQESIQMGIHLQICERPGFGLDIDLPEDLEYLKSKAGRNAGNGLHC
jgi:2-phospho-L-lactate guanylyltransferase